MDEGQSGQNLDEADRICAVTGLALVPSNGEFAWRIAKESWGPLNPLQRTVKMPRGQWGRYDVLGHRTIYAGDPQEGAYAESIAFARPAIDIELSELFDDDTYFGSLKEEAIKEWADRDHMSVGQVAAGWRQERLIYRLTLPKAGWFVDIEDSSSISAIIKNLRPALSMAGVEQLTTSHLRGEDRALTTSIAEWIHKQVLDDGSLPLGIVYGSKHDSHWTNWAVWLRAVDDGKDVAAEPTRAGVGEMIDEPVRNPPLRKVCDLFNLHCH
ncbi:RES domain-containing protein [Mycobacterium marinum]|uniref:RES domain-containing protein n=1 Tax=Mycobacterium marinum TaxID=1781 RepID=UPI002358E0DD|nr:RES domain-containing protein [Mycobacterium marinum]MDC8984357.1 RES domain-containing protein [Mycobacterium marinum]MDC9001452.1 RES domain-containing protein [Mycobacterium marinum]MDC9012044.1 RES domain-containing protein [Mycobacterium marinum]